MIFIVINNQYTSRCCHTYFVGQEEPQTVDEVGLASASSAGDYHSQRRRGIALHMLQYDVVCLQLLSLEVVRAAVVVKVCCGADCICCAMNDGISSRLE